jgi:hypothetical protein
MLGALANVGGPRMKPVLLLPTLLAVLLAPQGFAAQGGPAGLPKGFVEVRPVTRTAPPPPGNLPQLAIAQGRFFNYAMPPGWRVAEDGQFALTLLAADSKALTVMVGNAGVPPNYPPAQYAYERLMAIRPEGLQLGPPRQVRPIAGFAQSWEFPVMYRIGGVPCRGVAKVHIAPSYDSQVMAMTAALSEASQWGNYASWLPLVADQISASNGAAFGARGVMQQNLQNSQAYAEAAREYRSWSQKNWQTVTDQRGESNDRNNREFREALGGVQTFANPHDSRTPVELPNTYQNYWVNEKGTIVGTNDPSVNPNSGSTSDWRKMPKREP